MSMVFTKDVSNRQKFPPGHSTVQKLLDENAALIQTIGELQNSGRIPEAAEYQQTLHRNLVYLANLADDAQNLLTELQLAPNQVPPGNIQAQQQSQINAAGPAALIKPESDKTESKQHMLPNQAAPMQMEQQQQQRAQPNSAVTSGANAFYNGAEVQQAVAVSYYQQQTIQQQQQIPMISQSGSIPAQQMAHQSAPVSSSIAIQSSTPVSTVYVQQQSNQQPYYHDQQFQQSAVNVGPPVQQMYGNMQQQIQYQQVSKPSVVQISDPNIAYYQHQPRYQHQQMNPQTYQVYQQQQQQPGASYMPQQQPQAMYVGPQQVTSRPTVNQIPYSSGGQQGDIQVVYNYAGPPQQQIYQQQNYQQQPPPSSTQ